MPGNLKLLERVRNKTEVRRDTIMIPIPHERRLGPRYVKIVVKRLDEIISNEKGAGDAGN